VPNPNDSTTTVRNSMESSRKLSNADSEGEDDNNLIAELMNVDDDPNTIIPLKKLEEEEEKVEDSSPKNKKPDSSSPRILRKNEKHQSTKLPTNFLKDKLFKGLSDDNDKKKTDFKAIINESDFENLEIYKNEVSNFGGNMYNKKITNI
jgi:hypothetical protein